MNFRNNMLVVNGCNIEDLFHDVMFGEQWNIDFYSFCLLFIISCSMLWMQDLG